MRLRYIGPNDRDMLAIDWERIACFERETETRPNTRNLAFHFLLKGATKG